MTTSKMERRYLSPHDREELLEAARQNLRESLKVPTDIDDFRLRLGELGFTATQIEEEVKRILKP